MKKVLLLMFCALMGFALNAQISDDFSGYAVDGKIAQQAQAMGNDYWTTWSDDPGSAEDGVVAEIDGNKCGHWTYGNDQILLLGEKTSGIWDLSFKVYVPANKRAYFNVLAHFDGDNPNNCEWALEVYFYKSSDNQGTPTNPGVGSINAGSKEVKTFEYVEDAWTDVKLVVDLDDDDAELFINGVSIHQWEYSKAALGGGCVPIVYAMDMFPPDGTSEFYMDDIVFEVSSNDPKPSPVVSIMPDDELKISLQPDATKSSFLYINSEEEGTLKARWSTYIDYAPLETGEGPEFIASLCDPYENPNGGIGSAAAVDREIAMKLTPADYVDKLGTELKEIGFYILDDNIVGNPEDDQYFRPGSDLTFRVYSQGPAENVPGDLLAEEVLQMADFMYNAWNFVEIDPVQLTGGEYWVSVAMFQNEGSYPLTHTSNLLKYNGDWMKTGTNGAWGKLSDASTIQYNWAIQAKGDGKAQKVWGLMDQAYGRTLPASESEITVTVNATNIDEDTYTANIVILTNDPNNPRFDLPLIMRVSWDEESNDTSVDEVTVDGIVAPADPPGSQYDFRAQIEILPEQEVVDIVVTPHHPLATVSGQQGEQSVKSGQNVYTFTVTAEDGTKQEYNLLVYATIKTAISEIDNSIKLFPNPVSDYLYITSDYTITIETITIYDLTGKVVKQVKQPGTSVNLSDLSAGYYMLKVTTAQGDAMHKFVKE